MRTSNISIINQYKSLEQIQLEGVFKLRKIFSSRSLIPEFDPIPVPLQDYLNTTNDELVDSVQAKTETLPMKIDFNQDVNYANQVLNYNTIKTNFEINKLDETDIIDSKNNLKAHSG